MNLTWKIIQDEKVVHIWVNDLCEDCAVLVISVHPDWYQENGTPQCECGEDLIYSHTQIQVEEDSK